MQEIPILEDYKFRKSRNKAIKKNSIGSFHNHIRTMDRWVFYSAYSDETCDQMINLPYEPILTKSARKVVSND